MGSILAIGESLPPCDYSAAQVGWNWWLPGLVCQNCWLLNERNEPLVKSLYYRVPSDGVCNFFYRFLVVRISPTRSAMHDASHLRFGGPETCLSS
jgi:hypothetical protein